jgi:hypothetical protein
MNMPGFTAEATCYPTNRHNHAFGISASTDAAIYPAILDKDCYTRCRLTCDPFCEDRNKGACHLGCRWDCISECTF